LTISRLQTRPLADARTGPVGAHYPARAHQFARNQHTFLMKTCDRSLPQHSNPASFGMIDHGAVQMGPPDPIRGSARKRSLRRRTVAHESNAPEWIRVTLRNRDAESAQRLDAIRHQPFAARLIDRRNSAIRDYHAQPATARCDGRCQTCRSTANYKHIHRI
jgi:hypothetical protein